jgi:hypothetical protein
MKIAASIFTAFIAGTMNASAFVSPHAQNSVAFTRSSGAVSAKAQTSLKSMSDELDIPCDDDCAVDSYPDLPESVHPGVLSGQAMVDLLDHAKANGTLHNCEMFFSSDCSCNGMEHT